MPVQLTAKFLGILDIPLLYCDTAPFVEDNILAGAFSQTSASDVCAIDNYWISDTEQYAQVRRYVPELVNGSQVNTFGSGAQVGGLHTNWKGVMLGSNLNIWTGAMNAFPAGYVNGTVYCGPTSESADGIGTTPWGNELLQEPPTDWAPNPWPLAGTADFNTNGTMECALYVWRSGFRVVTNQGQVPQMRAWNPLNIIGGYIWSFYGSDIEGHPCALHPEYTLGNSPDYSNGINYTLYCDNQGFTSQADTKYYISKWFWKPFVGAPEILEELYSEIVWSDPNFPFANLQYQKVASVTGGFVFSFYQTPYTLNGVDYWHVYLKRDGTEYYLLNAVWLFSPSSVGGNDSQVLNNANTQSFARDKFGTWYACSLNTFTGTNAYIVGTDYYANYPSYRLYDPSNIAVKSLSCFNPCTTFPMYGAK